MNNIQSFCNPYTEGLFWHILKEHQIHFAMDGGAFIGAFAKDLLLAKPECRFVVCYEPLPENVVELTRCIDHRLIIRPVALSDRPGKQTFHAPNRLAASHNGWPKGCSFDGALDPGRPASETSIQVECVRLEDEPFATPDLLKLDLQGGEMAALHGLGSYLRGIKLLYIEYDLFRFKDRVPYLRDKGYRCFYDHVQFGCDDKGAAKTCARKYGINIIKHDPDLGFYTGSFTEKSPLNENGELLPEARADMLANEIKYFQTDILAIREDCP